MSIHTMLALAVSASLASLLAPAQAQTAPEPLNCPVLELQGVKPGEGSLRIAVYGSAESFNKKPMFSVTVAAPAGSTYRLGLCGVSSAEAAVTLFQDTNDNGKMDTNIIGIPSEPWGASGRPVMGPPSWDAAKVAVNGQPIVIKLN
jgi:uncharacterized protein (DUF2141 family)